MPTHTIQDADHMSKAAPNKFVINSLVLKKGKTKSRVVCDIDKVTFNKRKRENVVENHKIFFEAPAEYTKYLVHERCDAFVVLVLRYSLSHGYNIESAVPMSEDLYFNITERLLPNLVKNGGYDILINVETAPPLPPGTAVGTGISCGVDCFNTIVRFLDHPIESYRLTHLCINNVGAFNSVYRRVGKQVAHDESYRRAEMAAKEIGLPLIETDSNVTDLYVESHLYSHNYSSAFAVLCMKKLWRCYLYSSSGEDFVSNFTLKNYLSHDSSRYELLLYSCFSTSSLTLITEGDYMSRFEKIERISDYPPATKYLYSCVLKDKNCGRCSKCLRNLLALDALGKLDRFDGDYDIAAYRNRRERNLRYLIKKKETEFFKPTYEAMVRKKDKDLLMIENGVKRRYERLCAAGSYAEAVELVAPYATSDLWAARRVALS